MHVRDTQRKEQVSGCIVYDRTEEITLRSNDTFASMGYAEKDKIGKGHQLPTSPIRRLNINMIKWL